MNVDDRNEHTPEEQDPRPGEPGGDKPSPEEPSAEEPTSEEPTAEDARSEEEPAEDARSGEEPMAGEEPSAEEPTAGEGPGPHDPRGPQAPGAGEAPTEPLGVGPEAPAGAGASAPPRRLVRPRGDRVLGGVCAGLGRYFNTDPVFFRIAAIVLALIGGAGVLLYVAAVLLVPSEESAGAAVPGGATDGRNRGLVIAGVVILLLVGWPFLLGGGLLFAGVLIPIAFLVAAGVLVWWLVSGEGPSGDAGDIARRAALGVGVLILCAVVAFGGAWAAAVGGGALVAALVIGAGVAIVAGAFLKPVRWLILPAIALGLSAGTVQAAGIDLDGGVGEREYRPASMTDLRDRYELGMGELKIDLRQLDLPPGDTPLEIDLGVGQAVLLVADDVCVATRADVGVGHVAAFDMDNDGVDVDFEDAPDAAPGASRLVVDADLGVGELRVGHLDDTFGDADFDFDDDHGFDRGNSDLGTNSACLDTGESARG